MKDNQDIDTKLKADLTAWSKKFCRAAYLKSPEEIVHAASLITHRLKKEMPDESVDAQIVYGWLTGADIPRTQEQYSCMVQAMGMELYDEGLQQKIDENFENFQEKEQQRRAALKTTPRQSEEEVLAKKMTKWKKSLPTKELVQIREAQVRGDWAKILPAIKDFSVHQLKPENAPNIPVFEPKPVIEEKQKDTSNMGKGRGGDPGYWGRR